MMAKAAAGMAPGAQPARIPWWSVLLMIVVFYPPMLRPFALLGGPAPWERQYLDVVAEGNPMRQFQLILLGLAAVARLIFLVRRPAARIAINFLGVLAGIFAMLIAASTLWSESPALTMRRVVAFGLVGLAAFAYRTMSKEEFLRLIFFTTLAGLAFGLAKEGMKGTLQPWNADYRFTGTLTHPNVQAVNCALVFLSGLALVHELRRRWLAVALTVPAAALFLTRSRTSLAALLGAVLFYELLALLRSRPVALVASLCLAISAGLSILWLEQVTPVLHDAVRMGRQESDLATLQGRTYVWEEAGQYIRERPWLGYGYDAFWTAERIEEFTKAVDWPVINAHSEYVEVLLGLGRIGLLVFLCLIGIGIIRASKIAVEVNHSADLFTAALLLFCALHGLLETLFVGASFLTFLFALAVLRLGFPARARFE